MVYPKITVARLDLDDIMRVVKELYEAGYRKIELNFPGSKKHDEKKIMDTYVLIRAYKR